MRVVIADDEAPAREKLERWLAAEADVTLVGSADDGLAAARCIARSQPDVVFLDIQMPGMSGLHVAAQLETDSAPLIVFVTAFDAHAVRAFDLCATDYLLKPYDHARFARALARVRERLATPRPGASAVSAGRAGAARCERLLVPDGERLVPIDVDAIDWLEADDNYVRVHTGGRIYLLRRTLHDLLAQLGDDRFGRIHRSAAVHLGRIESLSPLFKGDYEIRLRGGRTLRLSRRYREALFSRLGR